MTDATDNGVSKGWLHGRGEPSLSDVFRSIPVRNQGNWFRRALAFIGPGYLVSVGYMDPGNWATSIAGGASFGYTLLVVALMSNIMAIILQSQNGDVVSKGYVGSAPTFEATLGAGWHPGVEV